MADQGPKIEVPDQDFLQEGFLRALDQARAIPVAAEVVAKSTTQAGHPILVARCPKCHHVQAVGDDGSGECRQFCHGCFALLRYLKGV